MPYERFRSPNKALRSFPCTYTGYWEPSGGRFQKEASTGQKRPMDASSHTRSINKVILIGHLGRDAETKFTPSGVSVTKFSVATTRSWKDPQSDEWKEETNWTNVTTWRKENLANYLLKGKQIYVEGRLQARSYDDKDGKKVYTTEVIAEQVLLLGSRENGDAERPSAQSTAAAGGRGGHGTPSGSRDDFDGQGVTDDDIPF